MYSEHVGRARRPMRCMELRVQLAIWALESWLADKSNSRRGRRRALRDFVRRRTDEAQHLCDHYDNEHAGFNHFLERAVATRSSKIRWVVTHAARPQGPAQAVRAFVTCHALTLVLLALLVALPAALSPEHPLAVYAYLTHVYGPALSRTVSASTHMELREFVVAPRQVMRYQGELREAARSSASPRLFVIARTPSGALRQEPIRTWDGILVGAFPDAIAKWLSRKELSFLSDEVGVWLRGEEIEAIGHYHTLGGTPSHGDGTAQWWSGRPEIVVANGIVPTVYLNGFLVPYGGDVTVTPLVCRAIRSSEASFVTDTQQNRFTSAQPSAAVRSYLAYLRDHRSIDITNLDDIVAATSTLCKEFEDSYHQVFVCGLHACKYASDSDTYSFVQKLELLRAWTECVDTRDLPPWDSGYSGPRVPRKS